MHSEDIILLAAAGFGLLVILSALGYWIWRRRRGDLGRVLKGRVWDQARDVVIPDGLDGQVHIDLVLMTRRGLVALEIKRLRGAVFGSEKMGEWVMLDNGRRHGFRNPLGPLEERVAALSHFAGGIRVEAYVLLIGDVSFPKGRPTRTVLPEDLAERLEPVSGDIPDGWRATWGKIAGHAERR
ncbi:nuclease-related domain-containing protein [Gammaproteobacteria bacterium AB-CW1]|uniref:Nuclease-related domain-containing protein n=1 Tax=Natronospira elongata TaxID=3110268 RepID=A0AAP6JG59_9GAMM|nr:nuclease-related domain-containing protein [Gammaproteobacteria bacterium AB-CW1]